MFRHPKYYKELRKRNKSDQAISLKAHDGECERAPGPGLKQRDSTGGVPGEADISVTSLKQQATSVKLQAQIKNYNKRQAPSNKHQASSHKRQAPRFLIHGTYEND